MSTFIDGLLAALLAIRQSGHTITRITAIKFRENGWSEKIRWLLEG
jgi:hypothetical protein